MTKTRRPPRPRVGRTDSLTVRLTPVLRYAAELAATQAGTSLSAFITHAVEKLTKETMLLRDQTAYRAGKSAFTVAADVWEPHPADRLVRLATLYAPLMTIEEERLWRCIREHDSIWRGSRDRGDRSKIDREALHAAWSELCENAGISASNG